MAKKKVKKKSTKSEAPGEPPGAEAPTAESAGSMTKVDAVRAALRAGVEKPLEAATWIQEKFGIEIAPQMFSSYKSQLAKKTDGSASHGASSKGGSISLEAAEQVRDLVKQHGAETVKKLAEFFR